MADPTTIYLTDDLKDRVKVIARRRGRRVSPQITLWVKRIVERIETREAKGNGKRRKDLCRA